MRYVFAIAAAAGLAFGTASDAKAQFTLSIGNPYTGGGVYVGSGYGLAAPYGVYSSGYYGLGAVPPVAGIYSSGYYGYTPGIGVPYAAPIYGYRYGYRYPAYRYRYGFPGYRPFGRRYWW